MYSGMSIQACRLPELSLPLQLILDTDYWDAGLTECFKKMCVKDVTGILSEELDLF